MVVGYVMKAQKASDPTQTVYWAVIDNPDLSATLSDYDPADLILPASVDYTFETVVDGIAGAPSGFAGGDLSGQYPNPKVIKINGRPLADIPPDDGYVLAWKSAKWKPVPQNAPESFTPNRVITSNAYGKISADIPLPGAPKPFAVFMEKPIGNMSFEKLTQDMIDPGFSITTTDLNYEVGQIVTDPAFTVSNATTIPGSPTSIFYNRPTVSSSISDGTSTPLTLQDGAGNTITNINGITSFKVIGSFSGPNNTASSKNFVITAFDGTRALQADIRINWLFKFYFGVGDDLTDASLYPGNPEKSNFIRALSSQLANQIPRNISVNCGSGQYIYYAYPKSYGNASFTFNGLSGGFTNIGSVDLPNAYIPGVSQEYTVWKSNNDDFGNITIAVGI